MNPNERIVVEMERQHWVAVCNLLGEGKFNLVAPYIRQISDALAMSAAQSGNGETQDFLIPRS